MRGLLVCALPQSWGRSRTVPPQRRTARWEARSKWMKELQGDGEGPGVGVEGPP